MFNIKPDGKGLANVIKRMPAIDNMIPNAYKQDGVGSHPWIVDLDNDDRPEVILLVRPAEYGEPHADKDYRIFWAELTASGELAGYRLHQTDLDGCAAFVDVLGFLQTRDKHTHLFVNFAYGGTSPACPVLIRCSLDRFQKPPLKMP
ncbi:hypothetical protein DSCO28_12260 [Desulfosarcina ovata subsp. sediminis]|uniref:Uncharacterized protein n=2 Tax=Desulfosarcina ovata TaxID=83564 RepID=A0A5K7ZP85_9BACT|nr:hypothetical protein DSCO28_12260 [Desulfosarcina ovata subsp. sediminis]